MYIIENGLFYSTIFAGKYPAMWIRLFVTLTTFFILSTPVLAQEKEPVKVHPSFEINYGVGGLINSENFVFKNGLGAHAIADFEFHERVFAGFGVGYEQFDSDQWVPIFFDLKAFIKKNKRSAYFTGQLGYTLMWNDNYARYNSYTYTGGIMFSPGLGYKLPLEKAGALLFNVSYRQQFASIEYEAAGENYTDRLSIVLLAFKIGYLF